MRPEPHKLHLDEMRRAIADVRLAAGESGPRHYSRRFIAEGDALLFGAIKASQLIGVVERAAARDAIHARRAAILGAAA